MTQLGPCCCGRSIARIPRAIGRSPGSTIHGVGGSGTAGRPLNRSFHVSGPNRPSAWLASLRRDLSNASTAAWVTGA